MSESLPKTVNSRWDEPQMRDLVGHQVTEVWWSDEIITFVTPEGVATFEVEGDCCSHSYFHDLIGLDKLLAGPVVSVNQVDLGDTDATCAVCERDGYKGDSVAVYGVQIVTQHPVWGEVTTALSFRNDSNGYYGGWLYRAGTDAVIEHRQERLTADKVTS
jgi:hypothetical protein